MIWTVSPPAWFCQIFPWTRKSAILDPPSGISLFTQKVRKQPKVTKSLSKMRTKSRKSRKKERQILSKTRLASPALKMQMSWQCQVINIFVVTNVFIATFLTFQLKEKKLHLSLSLQLYAPPPPNRGFKEVSNVFICLFFVVCLFACLFFVCLFDFF